MCESLGPSDCPTNAAPSSCTPLFACECVSLVSSRCDWIVHRCLNASRGGVTVLNSRWRETERKREREHANASRLKDVWDLCDHAVRQDEEGRVFPGEIRRNPGAEEKVKRRRVLCFRCYDKSDNFFFFLKASVCSPVLCFCPWCCNHMMRY